MTCAGLTLTLTLLLDAQTARPVDLNEVRLPAEAARLNKLGMAAYEAGDYEAAHRELKAAYASMDPRTDLDGRDMVLASLRSALVHLYKRTGELRHLCRARTELLQHLETLLITFGEATELPDVQGTQWRLRQLDEKISHHAPRLGEAACDGPAMQALRPVPPPSRTLRSLAPPVSTRDRGRAALIVGATSLGAGGLLLSAMTYALFMRRASYDGIQTLEAMAAMQPGGLHTRGQRALADSQLRVASYHRTTAIATGLAGGALVLTGAVALLVRRARRNRPAKIAITPAATLTGASLFLTAHF